MSRYRGELRFGPVVLADVAVEFTVRGRPSRRLANSLRQLVGTLHIEIKP